MFFQSTTAERNCDKFNKKMLMCNFQWRQYLIRPYKSISIQKMSPRKSECQTVISLQNLLLSQTEVTLGDCDAAMVEQFHQLD